MNKKEAKIEAILKGLAKENKRCAICETLVWGLTLA